MIDYGLIAGGLSYYASTGFRLVEVPWFVSHEATRITRPAEARDLSTFLGELVGSGEQSFLHMMMQGDLEPGFYCCCTPCFRDEPIIDELHRNQFLKVELISAWTKQDFVDLHFIRKAAWQFFAKHLEPSKLDIVETEQGFDIEYEGIELGSYGIRSHEELTWVYGTGVAEPRLSTVIRKSKEGHHVPKSPGGPG